MGIILTIIFSLFLLILFPLGELARIDLPNNIAFMGVDIGIAIFSSIIVIRFIQQKKLHSQLLKPIAIFLSICLISLLINIPNLKQNEFCVSFLYFLRFTAYTSLYFVVCSLNSTVKKKIVLFLIVSGVLLLTVGYLQFFLYPSLRNLYYLGWDVHLYRMFSTFLDPNFFGTFLVLYLLLLLSIILNKNTKSEKPLYISLLALILLTLIAIVLTYSRSAYIMGIVGVVTFFILQKPSKKIIYSALIILSIAVMSYFGFTKYSEGTNLLRVNSSKARITTSENALIIFQRNPLFGVGFNAYRYAQKRYHFLSPNQSNITADHGGAGTDNSFLFVLATTGIIGFAAYLYLLWQIVLLSKNTITKNMFAPVIIASLVALSIDSFFINALFFPYIMIWMWIVIGLGENIDKSVIKD